MKTHFRTNILIAVCLVLIACGQLDEGTSAFSPSATVGPTLLPTFTPFPSLTATATIRSTDTPFPTLLPTIDPTLVPDLLRSSIIVQTVDGINGFDLRKITGWNYGFYPSSFCGRRDWLDNEHLLLFAIVGEIENFGAYPITSAIIINNKTGKLWIPPIPQNISGGRTCPTYNFTWSETLGVMVMSNNGSVSAYEADGDLIKSFGAYPDEFGLLLSPSGTKAMFGTVWIDLQTGKTVKIQSQDEIGFSAWSLDETQLFACCFYYGNVKTGQGYRFEFSNGLAPAGRDNPSFRGFRSVWIRDDEFVLTNYDFTADDFVDIPFIDPVARTYKDIHELTDIPKDNYCGGYFGLSPNKEYLRAHCGRQEYLITLDTFVTESYGDLWLTTWSKDSQYVLAGEHNSEQQQILSLSSRELKPLPSKSKLVTLAWHPTDAVLAYLATDGLTLITVDAQSGSYQEIELPTLFRDIVWSLNGERIALIAEDGSVWQIDYPTLENLGQLTPPLPGKVYEISWSPDGNSIAFVSGSDIYIVETTK